MTDLVHATHQHVEFLESVHPIIDFSTSKLKAIAHRYAEHFLHDNDNNSSNNIITNKYELFMEHVHIIHPRVYDSHQQQRRAMTLKCEAVVDTIMSHIDDQFIFMSRLARLSLLLSSPSQKWLFIQSACSRYVKWLGLSKYFANPGVEMVPALDIDLVWHCDMKRPDVYKARCCLAGCADGVIDHEADGCYDRDRDADYAVTGKLWFTVYGTTYTRNVAYPMDLPWGCGDGDGGGGGGGGGEPATKPSPALVAASELGLRMLRSDHELCSLPIQLRRPINVFDAVPIIRRIYWIYYVGLAVAGFGLSRLIKPSWLGWVIMGLWIFVVLLGLRFHLKRKVAQVRGITTVGLYFKMLTEEFPFIERRELQAKLFVLLEAPFNIPAHPFVITWSGADQEPPQYPMTIVNGMHMYRTVVDVTNRTFSMLEFSGTFPNGVPWPPQPVIHSPIAYPQQYIAPQQQQQQERQHFVPMEVDVSRMIPTSATVQPPPTDHRHCFIPMGMGQQQRQSFVPVGMPSPNMMSSSSSSYQPSPATMSYQSAHQQPAMMSNQPPYQGQEPPPPMTPQYYHDHQQQQPPQEPPPPDYDAAMEQPTRVATQQYTM